MTVLIETDRSFILTGSATLLDRPKKSEEAFEAGWAEGVIHKNSAYSYLVGKFVTSGTPNANGHIFAAEDLATYKDTVINAPLNVNHDPKRVIGTHIAAHLAQPNFNASTLEGHVEIVWNGDDPSFVTKEEAFLNPHVEIAAAIWKSYFPQEFRRVQDAHSAGRSGLSMECVPKSVTCSGAGSCGQSFDYAGRLSPTYCDHLNSGRAFKRLNQPHFVGGAVVIPPESPAWSGAEITELTASEQERLFNETKDTFTDLDDQGWEEMMRFLISVASN